MCKKKEFKWVVEDTIFCQSVFNIFHWGANYEKLVEATVLWKLHLRNLVGFSETRFANSRRQVYVNIHHEFPAIMTCLEQQIIDDIGKSASVKVREIKEKPRDLKGKILNVRCFRLTLSGLAVI